MTAKTKQGRPSAAAIAARPKAQKTKRVEITPPPVQGIICPACGRGMQPHARRSPTTNAKGNRCNFLECSLCGARLLQEINDTKKTDTIQPVTEGKK